MIAEDMTRLSGEIVALHGKRAALMGDLARGSKELSASVAGFCSQLTEARSNMAKRTKTERAAFLKNLKSEVNARRREVAMDLGEVRRSWSGRSC